MLYTEPSFFLGFSQPHKLLKRFRQPTKYGGSVGSEREGAERGEADAAEPVGVEECHVAVAPTGASCTRRAASSCATIFLFSSILLTKVRQDVKTVPEFRIS